eukprot:scaffold38062_cov194-Skeletonema_dohrnii-CCMP3373.AAC.2
MNPSPPATPQRRMTVPMDDEKMEAALSWIEKCIAIISTLSYSNLAAALMLLRFVRPTASFFLVLVGDFSQLAVVFLRIVAKLAEAAASALESVNETHFRTRSNTLDDDDVPTRDNYSKDDVEKQPPIPSRAHESSLSSEMNRKAYEYIVSDVNVSVQKKKEKKKSGTKKAQGRAKILQLREKRLKMGLKVADGCLD